MPDRQIWDGIWGSLSPQQGRDFDWSRRIDRGLVEFNGFSLSIIPFFGRFAFMTIWGRDGGGDGIPGYRRRMCCLCFISRRRRRRSEGRPGASYRRGWRGRGRRRWLPGKRQNRPRLFSRQAARVRKRGVDEGTPLGDAVPHQPVCSHHARKEVAIGLLIALILVNRLLDPDPVITA